MTKISKNSDNDDIWFRRFQQSLDKTAVQSREIDKNLFDQINSVMGNKSKYQSVQAAVDDMKARSGLTAYLNKKVSEDVKVTKKTAAPAADNNSVIEKEIDITPIVFKKHPQIKELISRGVIEKFERPGFFNNKSVYRIPLSITKTNSLCQEERQRME